MNTSIWQDIRSTWQGGNMLIRIIGINILVFLLINIVRLILWGMDGGQAGNPIYEKVIDTLAFPAGWQGSFVHFWSWITAMFLHEDFTHILWNLIAFYWFGNIVGDLIGDHRILPIYLMAGISGWIFYLGGASLLPHLIHPQSHILGASGAVMGIVVAAGVLAPDYIMRLILLGDIKLKFIVLAFVLLDVLWLANDANTGGHIAHLGGAVFGWMYVAMLRQGRDLGNPVQSLILGIRDFFHHRPSTSSTARRKPEYIYQEQGRSRQSVPEAFPTEHSNEERLNAILDKIGRSGIDSLSTEERSFLDKMSNSK